MQLLKTLRQRDRSSKSASKSGVGGIFRPSFFGKGRKKEKQQNGDRTLQIQPSITWALSEDEDDHLHASTLPPQALYITEDRPIPGYEQQESVEKKSGDNEIMEMCKTANEELKQQLEEFPPRRFGTC